MLAKEASDVLEVITGGGGELRTKAVEETVGVPDEEAIELGVAVGALGVGATDDDNDTAAGVPDGLAPVEMLPEGLAVTLDELVAAGDALGVSVAAAGVPDGLAPVEMLPEGLAVTLDELVAAGDALGDSVTAAGVPDELAPVEMLPEGLAVTLGVGAADDDDDDTAAGVADWLPVAVNEGRGVGMDSDAGRQGRVTLPDAYAAGTVD